MDLFGKNPITAPARIRSRARYVSPRLIRAVRFPVICVFLTAFAAAQLLSGCEDGTSSGVDNPRLTVSFQDSAGLDMQVTGDLNVYGPDQNPTVSPQPLWTIKLNNASRINLTADDIARINRSAPAKYAASKVATGSGATRSQTAESPTAFAFNLQLRTEDRKGQFAFGLVYDFASKNFSKSADPAAPAAPLTRLGMPPKPLVRYQAKLIRDSLTGTLNRVFIPGTPFQATLVDSAFAFEDLPEGAFSLRFLAADGHVFAVNETLDTHIPRDFTIGQVPISTLDTNRFPATDSLLRISAGPDREAYLNAPAILDAVVKIFDPMDPRLAILWRQLHPIGDTALPAKFASPTLPRTEVKLPGEGAYTFEVAATLGKYTKMDTVVLLVKKVGTPLQARIIQPLSADTLAVGRPFPVSWEMPVPGPVTLRASPDKGKNWFTIVQHLDVKDGPATYNWTPSTDFAGAVRAVVEVRLESDSSMAAVSQGIVVK